MALLLPLAALLLLAALCLRPVQVVGWSMYPLLRHGQLVVVERLSYRLRRPRRGEVALARLGGREVLKLVAALPGDRVAVNAGRVWVNGTPLELTGAQGPGPSGEVLPRGRYFLLSLAADVGVDSRQQGTVGRRDLLGRAWLSLWPPRRLP
ncbi:MAG: signal peptidase I [Dehalococcoidia bacterium]|jgi:signal peptidase I|nr:signal peptidase I [Dehalococcoidia bacterium]MDW8008624.1 signal peptidase I [Chloroflexota bacterium]